MSGIMVGCVCNFLTTEGLNPVAIIYFMKKKIPGVKPDIKSMTEPQSGCKPS